MKEEPASLCSNLPVWVDLTMRQEDPALVRTAETQTSVYFRAYRDPILRYVAVACVDGRDAEEVTQDTFLRLYRVLEEGGTIADVRRWLFTVARHLAIDRNRQRRRARVTTVLEQVWRRLVDRVPDPRPSPEAALLDRQRMEELRAALDELPHGQRQCIQLRAEGLLYREIAEVMGMSVTGVAETLYDGIVRLRQRVGAPR